MDDHETRDEHGPNWPESCHLQKYPSFESGRKLGLEARNLGAWPTRASEVWNPGAEGCKMQSSNSKEYCDRIINMISGQNPNKKQRDMSGPCVCP